jgi:dTDP-4-dehydrorhamnose 3,5-epimerase
MEIIKGDIDGLLILKPKVFFDERGSFFESYSSTVFNTNDIGDINFVQDNQVYSKPGVVRGLHFQNPPCAQGKLVRVVKGRVLDIAVDIRKGSPTYGKHQIVELSEENGLQFWIPEGFAHGYVSLKESIFLYKCTNFYAPGYDGTIKWNDPNLGVFEDIKSMVNFPIEDAIVSDKDKVGQNFNEFKSEFN